MATHAATITWSRHDAAFLDRRYSRAHTWRFDGGVVVPASSSPAVVPLPYSEATHVDPEEAFVAAISSCHMLWFLDFAARRRFIVDSYVDAALGTMGTNAEGRSMMATVTLRPHVIFTGAVLPGDAEVVAMHHEAHDACYIANSVRTVVEVQGTWAVEECAVQVRNADDSPTM